MASTFTDLGIEIMATGENAGTWGDKTNTNLTIVNTAVAGYVEQAVTNGGTLQLTITDGAATATAQNAVIKLTGTITGNSIVTVPDSIEKTFIVNNGTSGAYTVQFKTVSGTGVTFSTTDKGTKFVYTDGTNINEISSSASETLTSAGNLTLDATTDVILDAGGGDVFFKDAGTTFGSATNTSGNLIIKSGTTTALTFSGANVTAAGNLSVGGNLDVTGSFDMSDANITNIGSIALDTITNDGTDITLDSSGDIILDAGGADIFLKDDGTTFGSLTNSSGNLIVKSGTTTALTFSGANVTVAGDLTVSGDDITMGTNTAGNLLVADGTNFNSIAAGDLSEISTIANDDVFLAVDTSGGGLKKVARSTVVSGLATSSAISNVSEDTTPQLGGNLDMNGADIVTTSNATIDLAPNGTGTVVVRGNTNSGAIVFNCESNSHGQKVIAQPHSAGVTNVMLLPAGADSTLVSLVSTDTLTNKTLTSAVLNTGVSGSAILDEDNMASNSATQLATQQSIKAYVDSQVATADTLAELSDTTISSPSSGHILVYDGSDSFDNVAVSGDVTIAANGAVTIAATAVENSMLAGSIADSKLNTISTAGKVALTALEIDGGTDIGADLTTSDLIVVDDGAGGTNRKAALSRIVTLMSAQGFVTDDPTALAIALG